MNGRLLTTREVAERLGISPETALRWIDTRGLPAIRLTSRAIRFEEQALDRWLLERTTAAAPGRESASKPDQRRHCQKEGIFPLPANLLPPAAQDEEDH